MASEWSAKTRIRVIRVNVTEIVMKGRPGKRSLVRFSEEFELWGFYLLIVLMLVVVCVTDYLSNRKRFPCLHSLI